VKDKFITMILRPVQKINCDGKASYLQPYWRKSPHT